MSVEPREVIPNFVLPDASRPATITLRYRAVERVIWTMRQRLNEPMSLRTMAKIALLSPYHFNRVFRSVTGITPCRFLTMLRMEAAKRLLITTQSSVSNVCFGVGFNSLGSFTRDFTQFVGLSPSSLRRLAQDVPMSCFRRLHDFEADSCHGAAPGGGLTGRISAPDDFVGVIFVGVFATPIPQGRPVGCVFLSAPGIYHIGHVPNGTYYLFVAAFPRSEDSLAYLLPTQTKVYVGASRLCIDRDKVTGDADVTLRPLQLTDPPILVALPLLMVEHLSTREMAMA